MAKFAFFDFNPKDWLRDTRSLSPATKSAWIDILSIAWDEPERGVYQRFKDHLMRDLSVEAENLDFILDELLLVADISVEENDFVTIKSRRMVREESKREKDRIRKQRQRGHAPRHGIFQKKSDTFQKMSREIPHFSKPGPEDATAYAKSIGFILDGHKFCDYYESQGWKIGKNPMKDWKAAVRTWKRNNYENGGTHANNGGTSIFDQAARLQAKRESPGLRKVASEREILTAVRDLPDVQVKT